jgi:hypothetical protein
MLLRSTGLFRDFFRAESASKCGSTSQIVKLMHYSGKQTIGRQHEVRGIIVVKTITENLYYAVTVIPNVSLFEYEVSFQLKPAPLPSVN